MGNNPTKPTERKKSVVKQRKYNEGGITGKGFKKGQSGNPNGRPKKDRCISDILREQGLNVIDGKHTNLQLIVEKLYEKASGGDLKAIDMIFDRLEGKPAQKVEVEESILPTGFDIEIIKN